VLTGVVCHVELELSDAALIHLRNVHSRNREFLAITLSPPKVFVIFEFVMLSCCEGFTDLADLVNLKKISVVKLPMQASVISGL
jgi:hypothetical protein